MKFKINKQQFDVLVPFFSRRGQDAYYEIELEPVMDTASEMIIRQHLDQVAYDNGFKRGYAEGFHDGKQNPKWTMGYDFGSKNGDSVVVCLKKPDGSIEILKTL